MAHDREVAGLRCTEVLTLLPDYVDGTIDAPTRMKIEAHLAGCDWCERFGGEYATTVARLREGLKAASSDTLVAALRRRLEQEGLLPSRTT